MKILVVAPTPFFSDRGTHIRILEEALALEKEGHSITIATYHIGKDISQEIKTKIDVRRILRLIFWYKKLEAGPDWQKIILDFMLIRKVFFLTRTQRPDIIHGHLHEGVVIGWIVQKIFFWRKIKLVSDFHGSLTKEMLSHGYLKKGLKSVFSFLEGFINRLGDYALVSSWEMKKNIEKVRKDEKVSVILDGTNWESFQINPAKETLKKELELPLDKVVVTYTGGLVPNKGISYLFEAIKEILEKRKDVFFLLGGFPTEHVENFLEKNRITENVRLVSPLNYFELPRFLLACDVAIDPKDSGVDQASGKMLNYMSASLPIVCFDKPNNRNYLGEGGYFASEISGKGLVEGISFFADNPEVRKKRGELNRKKAKQFSWEVSGKEISQIYQSFFLKNKHK